MHQCVTILSWSSIPKSVAVKIKSHAVMANTVLQVKISKRDSF